MIFGGLATFGYLRAKKQTVFMEYMSQEGYDKLVAELRELESVELPRVRDAIAEARDKGDLSENFEYHAAKREQGRLLGQIRYRQRVLEHARVIDTSNLGTDTVQLLCKVEISNMANQSRMTYVIASPHEANLREGKISVKSPIAQALLNRRVGDTVEVHVPAGTLRLRIEGISR
jgi:transcription elongation factor GreA